MSVFSWGSFTTDEAAEITILDNVDVSEDVHDIYRKLLTRKDKRNEITMRDDYRNLAECGLILLGEAPP